MRIDGNDVLASYAATKIHMDEAREGRGPYLLEALTYRIGAHTTSDDPTKYRDEEEVEYWRQRDPIARFEVFLRRQGVDEDKDVFPGLHQPLGALPAEPFNQTQPQAYGIVGVALVIQ